MNKSYSTTNSAAMRQADPAHQPWVAWRHRFSVPGLALGLTATFGGALFLSVYLFVESYRSGGDVRSLLLGPNRAGA